jgi:hypothetical protein
MYFYSIIKQQQKQKTMKTQSKIFSEAHKLAKTFEGDYRACFVLALEVIRSEKPSKKVDLLKAKEWSPSSNMARYYFGKDYIQVNISKDKAYYKAYGMEINNIDEVKSQLSYFTGIEMSNILASRF